MDYNINNKQYGLYHFLSYNAKHNAKKMPHPRFYASKANALVLLDKYRFEREKQKIVIARSEATKQSSLKTVECDCSIF